MLNRIIDNTYLHSASRCISREAKNADDVVNFLRLIGEVLSVDTLWYVAAQEGPVYPISRDIARKLNEPGLEKSRNEIIRRLHIDPAAYELACCQAASTLSKELGYLKTVSLSPASTLVPQFVDEHNPDQRFHELLVRGTSIPETELGTDDDMSGRAVAFVLSRPDLKEHILRLTRSNQPWTPELTELLSTVVRMLVYMSLASNKEIAYLPSVSRARAYTLTTHLLNEVGIQNREKTALADTVAYRGILKRLVNSLVVTAGGDPEKILVKAFEVRPDLMRATRANPSWPRLFRNADALCVDLHTKGSQLSRTLEQLLGEREQPRGWGFIEKWVVMGLPVPHIKPEKLIEWVRFKWRRRHLLRVASNIFLSNTFDRNDEDIWSTLLKRSGVPDGHIRPSSFSNGSDATGKQ